MSLYLGENLISGVTTTVDKSERIGQIIQSTIPLTDAGLHLLDGALISGSGVYSDFVTYIAGFVTDYPDLFETEANWQTSVTNYGVCGKFVYNSTNNTVRLPKITGILEGTTDLTALGDLIEAGLPNITGSITNVQSNGSASGAITYSVTQYGFLAKGTSFDRGTIGLDASLSNPIYGNSLTVQPQSIKVLYYIVIATTTKTEIESDIDQIATDLNGKADVDLSNISASQSAKNEIVSWCMPDYENQITGSSANWVLCTKDSFVFTCGSDSYAEDYYCYVSPDNGTTKYMVGRRWDDTNSYTQITGFTFFCPKNWYFKCTSDGTPSYYIYPLKGAN